MLEWMTDRDEGIPVAPPAALRAREFELGGETLVVFSYPIPTDERVTGDTVRLTAAQSEVATLAAAGKSNAEIAEARGTAVSTVAKQLESIYQRLGINTRRELALMMAADVTPST